MNAAADWAPAGADETGFLDRPGARLYYEVAGDGPALVFAHGLGGNHLSWWQQVPFFRDRYRCVTFAHRGFAPSTCAGAVDPAAFADDLEALLAHLRVDRFAIVGQSMGGWCALETALRAPARVRAMVLAATSGTLDPKAPDPARFVAWTKEADTIRAGWRKHGVHPALGARAAQARPDLHHLYRAVDALSHGLDKDALRARLFATRTRPLADVAKLAVPTLFATGGEDRVFPSYVVDALAAGFPDARRVDFPQAGHSAYFEAADAFNRAVDTFLASAGAAR